MKKRTLVFVFLMASFLFAYPQDSTVFAKGINWRSAKDGLIAGKEENKNILMHFYTDWCGYCTKMNKETFSDPRVISYINKKYIPIRVNNDTETIADISVPGVPDTWFMTSTGEKIAHQPGFIDREKLLSILKFVHTGSYKKMSFMAFLKQKKPPQAVSEK